MDPSDFFFLCKEAADRFSPEVGGDDALRAEARSISLSFFFLPDVESFPFFSAASQNRVNTTSMRRVFFPPREEAPPLL